MRINKFVAQATGLSRRAADAAVAAGRVTIDRQPAQLGDNIGDGATIQLDGRALKQPLAHTTLMLNKPFGYVSSRNGQGSQTIYDLLPAELHSLKPVGRLDKDSSGLLLLTDDGQLANQLTHPRYGKAKIYEVTLDKPLTSPDRAKIEQGITLEDGPSLLALKSIGNDGRAWRVTMTEGRNRQIRRSFAALGYKVAKLHRTQFGTYQLGNLPLGQLLIL